MKFADFPCVDSIFSSTVRSKRTHLYAGIHSLYVQRLYSPVNVHSPQAASYWILTLLTAVFCD